MYLGSPREDLSNITCLIPLTFAPKDGSVAIAAGDVTFTSDVAESGPCANNACAFFCDIFAPNRNSDMQKAIEKFVEDYVDSYSSIISALFSQSLQNLGVKGPIVAIKVLTDGDLSVEDKE